MTEIELDAYAINGPGLLIQKDDRTLLYFPDQVRATVTTDDATLRIVVGIDQETLTPGVMKVLELVPRSGFVNADLQRALGLGEVLREIGERVMSRWTLSDDGKTWNADLLNDPPVPRHDVALAFKRKPRRVPVTDLEVAAAAYRQAVAEGKPVNRAVQKALGLKSPATASRRIAKAREAGLLGPALDRKAGEK